MPTSVSSDYGLSSLTSQETCGGGPFQCGISAAHHHAAMLVGGAHHNRPPLIHRAASAPAEESLVDRWVGRVKDWLPQGRPIDPGPALPDRVVEEVSEEFRRAFRARAEAEPEGPLARFGDLMQAQAIAQNPEHPLSQRVDRERLGRQLAEVQKDERLGRQLEQVRRYSVREAGAHEPLEAQITYLSGLEFYAELEALEPAQRSERLTQELSKLAVLDPAAVTRVGRSLLDRDTSSQAIQRLKESNAETLAAGLRAAGQAAHAPLSDRASASLASALQRIQDVGDAASLAQNVTQMVAQLKSESPEYLDEAIDWISTLDNRGLLTTVLTGTSLITAFGADLETPEDQLKLATQLIQAGGSVSQMTHLPLIAGVLEGTRLAEGLLTTSQVLGPVGGLLSAGLSGYGAYESWLDGDLGRAGGLAASALGSSLLVGAAFAGPMAPALVVSGAALSIGGLVASRVLARDEDLELLKRLELLTPEPNP